MEISWKIVDNAGMPSTILIVDDERAIAETVEYALRIEGYTSLWCSTGAEALEIFNAGNIDLVILDVGLPDRSGFEVCKDLRKQSQLPIIFLTARGDEIDRVLGLEIGADDYVVKPFSPRELVARVKTILKRSTTQAVTSTKTLKIPFTIDSQRCKILFYETPLELSKYEFRILSLFIKWPGRVFSREEIMNKIWESPEMSLERTIDSHIKSLRAKLDNIKANCDSIVTHRGLGYSLRETW